ncbi:hypothetical protein HPL003_06430 [Paenibacillus terrae HPL-003]|uniref:Uncharacterized protein n=1 Tax=Paenibacillus terrae (strain HPL-003) TaxID=985665 RepID=G7W1P5_PAETH|nr:hypothetical protein HPL003_06430 [Paenibacillus terrae HPL-003]
MIKSMNKGDYAPIKFFTNISKELNIILKLDVCTEFEYYKKPTISSLKQGN